MYFFPKLNKYVIRAYLVHVFTTTGIICGILAIQSVFNDQLNFAFVWLGIALVVDGTDGFFARRYEVTKFAPRINGVILDAIVDFFNYVILPVIIILRFDFLPEKFELLAVIMILIASCFTFSNTKQKTKDNYFEGFPAIWNVLILDFFILNTSMILNLIIVLLCVILTFIPIKYVHPLRVQSLRSLAIVSFLLWGVSSVFLLFLEKGTPINDFILLIWIVSNLMILFFTIMRTFKKPNQ